MQQVVLMIDACMNAWKTRHAKSRAITAPTTMLLLIAKEHGIEVIICVNQTI